MDPMYDKLTMSVRLGRKDPNFRAAGLKGVRLLTDEFLNKSLLMGVRNKHYSNFL